MRSTTLFWSSWKINKPNWNRQLNKARRYRKNWMTFKLGQLTMLKPWKSGSQLVLILLSPRNNSNSWRLVSVFRVIIRILFAYSVTIWQTDDGKGVESYPSKASELFCLARLLWLLSGITEANSDPLILKRTHHFITFDVIGGIPCLWHHRYSKLGIKTVLAACQMYNDFS